ncbi:sucrase ferredoxin [cf. Phormidesmis sp. LEGE 11477]|nr:sucrase ferredoxin [cf. Phormidesmis sp. LEGE 11477]
MDDIADCRYCSQVSKLSGEDPIGSAQKIDCWLIVEIPQPWPTSMFTDHPVIAQIIPLIKKLVFRKGIMVRPVAIAPDRDYSTPGFTRILYYQRPAREFAEYTKEEYIVPEQQAPAVAIALLNRLFGQTKALTPFTSYRQQTTDSHRENSHREILVCTHTQVDLACGRFGTPLYRQLRKQYGQPDQSLRVWQTTHFGGHQFAPTLIDLPTGQFWGHLEPEALPQLIERTGDPQQMKLFYRGWAGVGRFEQIAEREAWMKAGWDWFTYPRTVRVTRKGLTGLKQLLFPLLRHVPIRLLQLWLDRWTADASWIEAKAVYRASPDQNLRQGCYRIKIEEKSAITSATSSATKPDGKIALKSVKQYRCVAIEHELA